MESRLDWRRVFAWLERGYQPQEICIYFDLTAVGLGKKASQQLTPEQFALYKRLSNRNRKRQCIDRFRADPKRWAEYRANDVKRTQKYRRQRKEREQAQAADAVGHQGEAGAGHPQVAEGEVQQPSGA